MRALQLWLLLGGAWALPSNAADVPYWLARLAAAQQLSFSGSFAYERNGVFSTHRLWRSVALDGHVRERVLELDGAGVETVLEDGQLLCSSRRPASPLASASSASSGSVRALDAARLADGYDLGVQGSARVAGRDAVVLSVAPRDQYRYGLELYLDASTAVPLKSLLLNEKGQVIERLQFVQFEPQGEAPLSMQALTPGAGCQPGEASAPMAESATNDWQATWLPPGFELHSRVADNALIWLRYNDGLAHFSVFLEPLQGMVPDEVRSEFGPTVAVSRRMKVEQGEVMVTVVGEIPPVTAERVALSMGLGGVAVAP